MDDTENMITELDRVMTNAGMSKFQKKVQAHRIRTEARIQKISNILGDEPLTKERLAEITAKINTL